MATTPNPNIPKTNFGSFDSPFGNVPSWNTFYSTTTSSGPKPRGPGGAQPDSTGLSQFMSLLGNPQPGKLITPTAAQYQAGQIYDLGQMNRAAQENFKRNEQAIADYKRTNEQAFGRLISPETSGQRFLDKAMSYADQGIASQRAANEKFDAQMAAAQRELRDQNQAAAAEMQIGIDQARRGETELASAIQAAAQQRRERAADEVKSQFADMLQGGEGQMSQMLADQAQAIDQATYGNIAQVYQRGAETVAGLYGQKANLLSNMGSTLAQLAQARASGGLQGSQSLNAMYNLGADTSRWAADHTQQANQAYAQGMSMGALNTAQLVQQNPMLVGLVSDTMNVLGKTSELAGQGFMAAGPTSPAAQLATSPGSNMRNAPTGSYGSVFVPQGAGPNFGAMSNQEKMRYMLANNMAHINPQTGRFSQTRGQYDLASSVGLRPQLEGLIGGQYNPQAAQMSEQQLRTPRLLGMGAGVPELGIT